MRGWLLAWAWIAAGTARADQGEPSGEAVEPGEAAEPGGDEEGAPPTGWTPIGLPSERPLSERPLSERPGGEAAGEAPAEAAGAVDAVPLAPAEGKVANIRIRGLKRVEEAAIMAAIGLRPGDELAPWKVRRDIEAIWHTGFVDDVRVEVVEAEQGRAVTVIFDVDEKPAIREVVLAGNKKLDDDAINEVIDITPFSVLNEADVRRNARAIRDKYVEKGFYLAEVEPVVEDAGDDMVRLTFKITENRKVLVQRIDITGNEELPDRKIRRYMKTRQAGILPWLTSSGTFDEATLDEDVQIVRSVYLENGYVDATVDAPQVYLSPDKRYIYITINVHEGPRYKLGAIKASGDFVPEEGLTEAAVREIIEGATAATLHERWEDALERARKERGEDALPEPGWEKGRKGFLVFDPTHPPLKTGNWFKLSELQQAMGEISDLYGDQGYAFSNVVPLTETDPDARVVDLDFEIQRGDKVRIERIDITGNDPTFDKVIRREIPINEGDVYSGSAIKEARKRLDRLGYFEEVKITTPRGAEPGTLDMKVEVTEQPTGSFSVGAGFSSLENFVFTANVSKNNFLGLGYVMSAAANVSQRRQQWNLRLFDPYFLDTRWTLRVDGYSIARQFYEDEYQRGGNFAVGRYLDPRDDIRLEFSYTFENTGLINVDSYKKYLLGGDLYRNGITSTGGLSLVVDKRNNRIQATKGIYTTVLTALSGGFRTSDGQVLSVFGGDFNFVESKFNFRAYQPVIPNSEALIFKYNGTLGWIRTTDGSVLPYIHRYRAGGINSVRGYDWYSLGPSIRAQGYRNGDSSRSIFVGSDDPTNADDKLVVGGTETWINNFELESPIIPQAGISLVAFFDAGNAFGDPWGNGHINPADLRFAYGAGVRWFSPMGPLRFEWGFPINPRADERRAVFDFSMGSLF